ncbi:MAG: helix-turn-helix transcriptional regulator, partial [Raoultibacter sp.]
FPILIIGLLPIPFVDSMMQMICTLVILVGYICLTLVNLDSLYCLVKKYKVAPFYLIGRGHGPILAGVGIGYLVGYMAAITNIVGDTFLSIASLVLVITLSISITFIDFDKDHLADEHARNTEEDLAHYAKKGEGFWKARCSIVAQKYDLSAREIEVFTLLAKGRGTTYIQDKLYISPHTVKSHTYKIYKKLGINSREELLTLIEDTVPDNSDSE